ncbi:tetratricopeptide repeat protein [Geobacter sp. AOG2]|uniref:tetratricopeptide repeat protein n=1 Tax=Geobacter sp. AOG2 TaxID=1566347 RepID=UPI001CC62AD2|nr:tetratricopeptide repeat protein [Geobacter sp. AOG2]
MSGFNAYQQKNYASAIKRMNEVLQKYPDSPLRDMAIFWLARSYFKNGDQQDAARYMSQFAKEYPDNPLRATVEDELLALTARYDKGEKLPAGEAPAKQAQAPKVKPEPEQLTKQQAEKERLAKQQADQERQTAEKAEQEQQAREQAAKAELAKQQAEKDRLAKLKAEQERLAAEKAEQERLAKEQAAKEQLAKQQAEKERLAKQQADQERQASDKVEQEQQAKQQAAKAELAKQQAEKDRLAKLKAEQERLAAEKAEQERLAKEQAAKEQLAKQQAEKERLAKQQADQERQASDKVEQEQQAKQQAAKAELAKQRAEQERLAKLRAEQERLAVEKADLERLAKEQAAKEQFAKQRAEKEHLAKQQADQERIAAEQAEQEKLAQQQGAQKQAFQEKQAAEQAEIMRLAREKAEQKRLAILKEEEESKAAEQATQQRRVAVQAERELLAKRKAEEERAAAEAAAAVEAGRAEQRQVAAKAEEERQAKNRLVEEKTRAEKAMLREKAIAQYKSIIENYPGSSAAVTAAAKLKGLGVAVALPPQAAPVERQENAQVLRFEVGQYVGFEFNLLAQPKAYEVAQRTSIPFEVINRGNGSDSFSLESAFPAEFRAGFAAAGAPEKSIRETPKLAPGEVFRGVISFEIPPASIDGLKITYPVKAASTLMTEASQSREVAMTASAPLLRAVLKADKTHLLPGGQVAYRIVVLNIGTMAAKDVTLNLNYPPQLEPLDYSATGFKQGMKSVMISDGLHIKSGESREFSVAFRLKDDSLAGQELITRAELVNNPLKTTAAFVSNVAYIDPQHGVAIRTAAEERLVVIPGQTTTIPFVVTNTGNVSEKYRIAANLKSPQETVVIYHDINRDGIRQANEPAITEIGPLAPKEEAAVIVEVKTPRSVNDGTEGNVQLSLTPEGDTTRTAFASAHLFYSRPVLKMAIAARDGRLKPGEVASFDLTITNGGSNLARIVELQSTWPEQLELIGADPSNSSVSNGNILWKFKELGAGEKKAIKVSFRVRHGIGVGTNIQVKNILTYEDQLGNRY